MHLGELIQELEVLIGVHAIELADFPEELAHFGRRLWQIEKGHFLARTAWRFLHTCDALLQRPQSNALEDVARRTLVRDRLLSLNDVLRDVCAEYVQCNYDGGAAFRTRFDRGDVSSRDFFHPSRDGQELLAGVAWRTGFTAP